MPDDLITRRISQLAPRAGLLGTDQLAVEGGDSFAEKTTLAAVAAFLADLGFGPTVVRETVAELNAVTPELDDVRGEVRNDPAGDIADGNGVYRWADPDWIWVGPLDTPTVAALRDSFRPRATANYYDASDPAAAMGVIYNTADGAEVALASHMKMARCHVAPLTQVTMHINGAPTDFVLRMAGQYIVFFNAVGAWHSRLLTSDPSVTYSADQRQVTFTMPAGAYAFVVNIQDIGTPSAPKFTALNASIMVSAGAVAAPLVPFAETGELEPDPAAFAAAPVMDELAVIEQLGTWFVRADTVLGDAASHFVRRFDIGSAASQIPQKSGVVDLIGERRIAGTTPLSATIAAYNTSTLVHSQGGDEGAPGKVRGGYRGGLHGEANSFLLTMAAHGKTAADVGSKYTDGAGKVWLLTRYISASQLIWTPLYTGTATTFAIPAGITGTTLTHQSGGTNTAPFTYTAGASAQLMPTIRNYSVSVTHKGKALGPGAMVTGKAADFAVHERYEIMNPASLQDSLIAHAGAAVPDYARNDIATLVEVSHTYRFNRYGAVMNVGGLVDGSNYVRIDGDYFGLLQMVALGPAVMTGRTNHLYVPGSAPFVYNAVAYDFRAAPALTGVEVRVPQSAAVDPAKPLTHFAQILKNGGTPELGAAFGYSPLRGLGLPTRRLAATTYGLLVSVLKKAYPILKDIGGGPGVAGGLDNGLAYRAPFVLADPALGMFGIFTDNGRDYLVLGVVSAVTNKWVELPAHLVGRSVAVVDKHANMTLLSDQVVDRGIRITAAAAGDYLIAALG